MQEKSEFFFLKKNEDKIVIKCSFQLYPNLIRILSKFYPEFLETHFIQTLSKGKFRMNVWSHPFSQNMNKKLSRLPPSLHTTEILTNFSLYFGRTDDFINSFWNCLTFRIRQILILMHLGGMYCCLESHFLQTVTENHLCRSLRLSNIRGWQTK